MFFGLDPVVFWSLKGVEKLQNQEPKSRGQSLNLPKRVNFFSTASIFQTKVVRCAADTFRSLLPCSCFLSITKAHWLSYLSPKGDIQTLARSIRIPLLRQGRFLRTLSHQWFLSPGGHNGSYFRKTLWQVYLDGSRVCGHYCVPNHDAGPAPILFCSNNVNNKP